MKYEAFVADAIRAAASAPPEARRRALEALLGNSNTERPIATMKALRWPAAAGMAGCTTKTLRSWAKAAGIKPILLPGRKRSFGIREGDVLNMIGGRP